MSGNKFIVRLVDLVFILLFGFIAISQFDKGRAEEIAKSREAGKYEQDESTDVIVIGVLPDGRFPIGDGSMVKQDSTDLHGFLQREAAAARQQGRNVGIRIRARWDAPIANALTVANICKALGLAKGLDVVRVNPDG